MSTTTTTTTPSAPNRTLERTIELGAPPSEVLQFLQTPKLFLYARFDAYPRVSDTELNEQGIYFIQDVELLWPAKWKAILQSSSHGLCLDATCRLFRFAIHEEWTVPDLTTDSAAVTAKVKVVSTVKAPGFLLKTVLKFLERGDERVKKRWARGPHHQHQHKTHGHKTAQEAGAGAEAEAGGAAQQGEAASSTAATAATAAAGDKE